jgi:phenylpyruvate tautomerase PptA (4-oxalocrotonate tautomerase family)
MRPHSRRGTSTGSVARAGIQFDVPYLRITCPTLPPEQRRAIAQRLTAAVVDLFFSPSAPLTREDLRERTTVHFTVYGEDELFIGGRTPRERNALDVTVELSDWNMTVRHQRRIARQLTPVLAECFAVPPAGSQGINIRFHPYTPRDFAVGGRLLSDRIPLMGRVMKRLFSR